MLQWLTDLLSETGTASTSWVSLLIVIVVTSAWLSVWLGISLHKTGTVPAEWVTLVQWLLGYVTGTKVLGKFAETSNDKGN